MSLAVKLRSFLRNLLSFRRVEADLDEEVRSHLGLLTEENIRAGMSPKEAQRVARIELGGFEQVKEQVREERIGSWLRSVLSDCRYGLRQLRKNPGFSAVAILTLALGIGANTAIFSVIEAVILRPLPYKNPKRLVLLVDSQDPVNGAFLFKDIETFRSESRSLEDIAAYYRDSGFSRVTLTSGGEPESVQGAFVSANFFHLMGVGPVLGRVFMADEEARRERVVVLSYGLWRTRLGGSHDAIGKLLQIDGIDSQIIGVMPATFQFPARDQQFWAPITTNRYWNDPALATNIDPHQTRYFYERWQAIGRLSPGATIAQAQTEIDTVFRRSEPDLDTDRIPRIRVTPLRIVLSGKTRLALIVLFCAVSFILLISCSNMANLMLARGATREREMAVRVALGAGRGRLSRQLLTESAVLSVFAGAIGLALGSVSLRLLIVLAPRDIPRLEQAEVDRGALAFTLMVSLLVAGIFSLVPAWKTSRINPGNTLRPGIRSGGPSLTRIRSALVIAEFALAVVLLMGAGLLIRSFLALNAVDPGFEPEGVLTMNIRLPSGTVESRNAFYDAVLERVRALPGIRSAGEVDALFELGGVSNLGLRAIEGRLPEPNSQWTPLSCASIRGEYFQAVGVPLLRGRYFTLRDGPNSPLVAIIDESMARRYWPNQDSLGKRFKGQDPRGHNDDWLTVVGIVRDMRRGGLEKNPTPHVFEPFGQAIDGDRTGYLVVRTTSKSSAAKVALREAIRTLSNIAILSNVSTMEEQLAAQLSPRRFQTSLLGLFSGIALALAVVGIFGVMHYSVAQRTQEIGIRVALGAQSQGVLRLVLGQAMRLAFCGIAIGISAGLALTRFMASLLFGISPTDVLTIVVVTLLLALVSLFACYLPAHRATRVDPMVALRYE